MIRPFFDRIPTLIAVVWLPFFVRPSVPVQQPQSGAPTAQFEMMPPENGLKLARAKESVLKLSLEGSELKAEPPLSSGPVTFPHYVRELVQLKWRPMDPIDLWVIRPAGVKKPPVVLYLYGYPSETDRFHDVRVCQRLVQGGAAAVGFVSALTGHRYGHRPLKEWFVSELPEALATTVHDVQMILNYLATRGDLDMSRVGMFGQGSGGAIAILAAATDPRIKVVDLLNPWGDWPDWLAKASIVPTDERAPYLQPDFLKRLEPLEPVHFLLALESRIIRIQFFDDDGNAPKETADKLTAAAPVTAKISHYPNARASFAASGGAPLFEWIATALKPPTEKIEKKDDAAKMSTAATARWH